MAAVDPVGVFVSTILPVLSLAGVGALLGWRTDLDVEGLNTVVVYVLLPALVFHSLLTSSLGGAASVRLGAAVWVFTLVMLAVAAVVARTLGESGAVFGALVLAAAFPNAGNFGIPVSTYAFGTVGRDVAVLFVVAQNVLVWTVGAFVVARSVGTTARSAVRTVFELPLIYAVILAGVLLAVGAVPPADGTVLRTVGMAGEASIPLFLIVLGVQVARTDAAAALRRTAPAVGLKLLVAPLVGLAVALALGFEHPAVARTFVLETAGPVAITPLALVLEFAGDDAVDPAGERPGAAGVATDGGSDVSGPAYVATAILLTTLGCVPVVTGLIALLRAGVLL